MNALIINTTYNIGSTGKLTFNLRKYLIEHGHSVCVIFGQGMSNKNQRLFKVTNQLLMKINIFLGRLTGLNDCFSFLEAYKVKRIINRINPDVVYLGNLHGYYLNINSLFKFLRKKGKPIIHIMWDEFPMTGKCTFSFECEKYTMLCQHCPNKRRYPISWFFDTSSILMGIKKKSYSKQNIAFVAIPYTVQKARQSSLLSDYELYELDEAVDQIGLYYPRNENLNKIGCIPNDKIVILTACVYPDYRKGGAYFIELAKKCVDHPEYVFVHIGFMADKEICPPNFIPIGYVRDQNQMAKYYSVADLFVCPSLAETQPNACIEALSCGTNILGFNVSGIPSCAPHPFGHYVEKGNVDAMKRVVLATKKKTPEMVKNTRKYAESRFSAIDYNKKLERLAKEMLSK